MAALAFFYGIFYFGARMGNQIIHIEDRGDDGSRVFAKPEEWIEITKGMAEDSDSFLLKADATFRDAKPILLNAVFWPLRKLEESYWNSRATTIGEQAQALNL